MIWTTIIKTNDNFEYVPDNTASPEVWVAVPYQQKHASLLQILKMFGNPKSSTGLPRARQDSQWNIHLLWWCLDGGVMYRLQSNNLGKKKHHPKCWDLEKHRMLIARRDILSYTAGLLRSRTDVLYRPVPDDPRASTETLSLSSLNLSPIARLEILNCQVRINLHACNFFSREKKNYTREKKISRV